MWHEARRHEKKIRVMIVDYRKRAERRREFYEKFKADPTQFMQVHGRPIKIHMDPQVTAAADKCLVPWQGNPETTIDRFDVRAHLDHIPDSHSHSSSRDEFVDETEEACLNYERYRILIQNELAGISEDKFLHQIHIEEQYGTAVPIGGHKAEAKAKQQKAAIAYTYDDSTPNASSISSALGKSSKLAETAAAEEESDEDMDFDLLVNVKDMTIAQKSELNNSGMKYGLKGGDFMNFLNAEIKEKEDLRLAKLQEEEKQAMSGRKARRERRAYKDKVILRKGCSSPPSYAATTTSSPGSVKSHRSTSRSRSRSGSTSPEKIVYITSFGENDRDEGRKRTTASEFGPSLPSGGSNQSYSNKRAKSRSRTPVRVRRKERSKSPVGGINRNNNLKQVRRYSKSDSTSSRSSLDTKTKSKGCKRRRSRTSSSSSSSSSGHRSRSRTHSRHKSRSRSRSLPRYRSRRSGDRYRRHSESRSRSRSRTRTNRSRRYSRSRSRSNRRHSSHNRTQTRSRSPRSQPKSNPRTRSSSSESRTDSSHSSLEKQATPKKLPSPPVKRYYGREKSSASRKDERSSMSHTSSEDEEEQVDLKTRNSQTSERSTYNSGMKNKSSVSSSAKVPSSNTGESLRNSQGPKPQDRLRRQMQKALNRQLKADKEAQQSRFERLEQERLEREESLRELSIKYRRRERERRHRSGRDSRSCSTSSMDSGRSVSSNKSRSPCMEF